MDNIKPSEFTSEIKQKIIAHFNNLILLKEKEYEGKAIAQNGNFECLEDYLTYLKERLKQ